MGGQLAVTRAQMESLPVGSVVDFVSHSGVVHTVIRCDTGGAGAGRFSLLSGQAWADVADWPKHATDRLEIVMGSGSVR